ncbi:hypothetical protein BSKO_03790 [Bryopsis sp. KO-2023]|nr:hypothetical protein BSKO_03790 [Bryopsis sp. KO-2023]
MLQSAALTTERTKVGVIGGGAWGTALGIHCARMGHDTLLWALEKEVVADINGDPRENRTFLAGHKIPDSMRATGDLDAVIEHSKIILMVVPTPFVAKTLEPIASKLKAEQILVSCTKGILNETLETVNEIFERVFPESCRAQFAYLSGPSFAAEVATEAPSAVTVASKNEDVALRVQQMLSTPRFRCYRTTDVAGVELGGALKNVLAIACGICDGLKYGNNARAALITRGLNEITRLAVAKGANPLTMGGLAGMGDLVLTCTGDLSRNRTVGLRIGRGESLEDITKCMRAVAEGVLTSRSAHNLSLKLGVDCPIVSGIYRVLHEGANPGQVTLDVMSRALKSEVDEEVMQSLAA